jgi:hypothetical protein
MTCGILITKESVFSSPNGSEDEQPVLTTVRTRKAGITMSLDQRTIHDSILCEGVCYAKSHY